MKKLITLTMTIVALFLSAVSAQAHHVKKPKKIKTKKFLKHVSYKNKGHFNRRGVYVYHTTKKKWINGKKYKMTYKVKVFPSGRKKVKLINVQRVRNHYGYHRVKTYYRTYTIFQNWRPYRVTYKIKRFPNGKIKKKMISKVRLRYL